MSRLSHFLYNWRVDGGEAVSLKRWPRFTPRHSHNTHFCCRLRRYWDHSAAGMIWSIENKNPLTSSGNERAIFWLVALVLHPVTQINEMLNLVHDKSDCRDCACYWIYAWEVDDGVVLTAAVSRLGIVWMVCDLTGFYRRRMKMLVRLSVSTTAAFSRRDWGKQTKQQSSRIQIFKRRDKSHLDKSRTTIE
jgi:hypothetical protein